MRRRCDLVEAVRSARSARALVDPAASAEISAVLRSLPARGGCATLARDVVVSCDSGGVSPRAALAAATHPACPPGVLVSTLAQVLGVASRSHDLGTRLAVIAHPACSAQMLRDMASDDSPEPVRKVAAHRLCPSDVLASLSFHPDEGVRARVAANAACPVSMLKILAVDSSPQTRARVAANAACPVSMLTLLAVDSSPQTRAGVAANAACPVSVLTLLAVDSSPQIRAATVSHPRCPSSVALLLSVDIEAGVRAAVASRPGVGAEILQLLARDVSAQVRSRAETSLAGVRSPAAPRRGTFPAAGGWLSPNRQPCRFHQIRGRFPQPARSGHQRGVWRRLLGGARLRRR